MIIFLMKSLLIHCCVIIETFESLDFLLRLMQPQLWQVWKLMRFLKKHLWHVNVDCCKNPVLQHQLLSIVDIFPLAHSVDTKLVVCEAHSEFFEGLLQSCSETPTDLDLLLRKLLPQLWHVPETIGLFEKHLWHTWRSMLYFCNGPGLTSISLDNNNTNIKTCMVSIETYVLNVELKIYYTVTHHCIHEAYYLFVHHAV